ncbi:hypothetical protein M9Y10_043322 [Tritrichomonas musculus]|uniref:Leucine-rich repeat domain, L domain-containing protein n=1 Tax=Tritrichomonas musculus TaxID=1915356 RepID=A0ABR2JZD3_9EUKA
MLHQQWPTLAIEHLKDSNLLSDRVTSIPDNLLNKCSTLIHVIIPPSVSAIGSHSFHGCTSLTNVQIPPSVTFIDESAFECCSSFQSRRCLLDVRQFIL